jgi:anaerobic selenocysteine-containing dehydrogenase
VFNALGEVHCLATVTPKVPRGVVSLPKGLWQFSTFNGATANSLAPDTLSDLGANACFNDARVQVTRLVSARMGDQRLAFWVGQGERH